MKQILTNLKVILTLMLLCGVSSVWAETATFTFNTKDGLNALGITPPAASSGTDIGSDPYVVGDITMTATNGGTNTRVWNSDGAFDLRVYKNGGSLTFTAASGYEISSVAFTGTCSFSFSSGSFSKSTWSGLAESIKLTATGTAKITTITVTYSHKSSKPVILASDVAIDFDATSGEIAYTIVNPVEGKSLTASTDAEWISNVTATSEKVTFNATKNTGDARTAQITLKYDDAEDKVVKVTQKKYVPTYLVLYSVLGEEAGSEEVSEGGFIKSAPAVKDMAGWKFTGWTAVDNYEQSTVAPEFFTATTPVTDDVILYAVFSKEDDTNKAWRIVSNASSLKDGDKVIIASVEVEDEYYAAQAYAGKNNVPATSIEVEDGTITSTDGLCQYTLGVTADGYTFFDGTYYLYAAGGSSNNYLKGEAELDDKNNGLWNISISGNVASISSVGNTSRGIMQFNPNKGNPLFACYSSASQKNIALYRMSGATTYSTNIPMYYDLAMSSTGYATLYLDYPSAIPYGFKAYRAEAVDASGTMIKLEEIQDNVPANFGVLVKGAANATATFKGFYIPGGMPTGIHNLFRGVVEDTEVDDVAENTIYVLNAAESTDANPKFSQYTGTTLNANKAYLDLEVPAGANLTFVFGDATGIDTVETVKAATTRVNLAGQVVGKDYKGVVIENGKKFLNK